MALAAAVAFIVPSVSAQEQEETRGPGCYLAGGLDALERGDLSLAEAEFRGAVKASSGSLEAREDLAIVLARERKLDEAVAEFREALAERPFWPEVHCNLGMALLEKKTWMALRNNSGMP